MTRSTRYSPHWPFPSYIFVPGKNPHPKKWGGHMEGENDPVAPPIDPENPQGNEFLRYALDLYNFGYFWEGHVYFEGLWNAHARTGSIADFAKGMIKLCAAGVKISIGQKESAVGHFLRAKELFSEIQRNEGEIFLGFDLVTILSEIEIAIKRVEMFKIHPSWS